MTKKLTAVKRRDYRASSGNESAEFLGLANLLISIHVAGSYLTHKVPVDKVILNDLSWAFYIVGVKDCKYEVKMVHNVGFTPWNTLLCRQGVFHVFTKLKMLPENYYLDRKMAQIASKTTANGKKCMGWFIRL